MTQTLISTPQIDAPASNKGVLTVAASYAAPQLTELGAWQTVTLIVTLPIQLGTPGTQGSGSSPRF